MEKSAAAATKAVLEELLKRRRLQAEDPPLRGEDRRRTPLPTGITTIDSLLQGGFPRGRVSELYGPPSSGRTGIVLALVARLTRQGYLAAWVDPADRFDPASAAAASAELQRLLWLRGRAEAGGNALLASVAAVGTLVGSGLFEAVVLDLGGIADREFVRLPEATWIRLQRAVENTSCALVLIADRHVVKCLLGASLALRAKGVRFSGAPGSGGRLLRGLDAEATAGPHGRLHAEFALHTFV